MGYEYSDICELLSYDPQRVENISVRMEQQGHLKDYPITLWSEGGGPLKILDGRHRYEAALKAGIEPLTEVFEGTRKEALALAVKRAFYTPTGDQRSPTSNDKFNLFVASGDYDMDAQEAAKKYVVSVPTIYKWREAVRAIEEALQQLPTEGKQEFEEKKPHEQRREVKPQGDRSATPMTNTYNQGHVNDTLLSVAHMVRRQSDLAPDQIADSIFMTMTKGCEATESGMQFTREVMQEFLELKVALDILEQHVHSFFDEAPNLKIV